MADLLGGENRHDTRDLLHSRFFVTIYAVFVALAAMTAFNSNDKDVKAAKIIVCTALVLDIVDCGAHPGGHYPMDGLNRGDYGAST